MVNPLSRALAETIGRSFEDGNRWHSPMWELVGNLSVEQALWRPGPERKCIWELVRHTILWRKYLLARLSDRPTPDWRSNNWTLPPETDEQAWRADLNELQQVQAELVAWFEARGDDALLQVDEGGSYSQFMLEAGIIGHDSYHTGQIAYVRALMGLSDPQGD